MLIISSENNEKNIIISFPLIKVMPFWELLRVYHWMYVEYWKQN